ncbi:hypothetical protein B0H12DRAFT_1101979, partial [Mycena haematopus]
MNPTTTVPAVQCTTAASTTVDTRDTIEAKPVTHSNGPQCAHCSWPAEDTLPTAPSD